MPRHVKRLVNRSELLAAQGEGRKELIVQICKLFTTVDDFVWITVFALAISSIPTIGLTSMLVGGLFVFIPQIALALIPPHKTLGGADIKLSTALAFLLGTWRGIGAYMVGLILAVVIISIYHRRKNSNTKQPFALVPFLSIGAMILFFV